MDKDSEEAEIIRKYVKNTHATTHNAYDLEVVDVRRSPPPAPFVSGQLFPAHSSDLGLGRKEWLAFFK